MAVSCLLVCIMQKCPVFLFNVVTTGVPPSNYMLIQYTPSTPKYGGALQISDCFPVLPLSDALCAT